MTLPPWIHQLADLFYLIGGMGSILSFFGVKALIAAWHDHTEKPSETDPNPVLRRNGIRRFFRLKTAD